MKDQAEQLIEEIMGLVTQREGLTLSETCRAVEIAYQKTNEIARYAYKVDSFKDIADKWSEDPRNYIIYRPREDSQ